MQIGQLLVFLLGSALVFSVYLYLRSSAQVNLGDMGNAPFSKWFTAAPAAIGYFALKLVLPWPQLHFVPELPKLGTVAAGGALLLCVAAWAIRSKRADVALVLVWFFCAILPFVPLAVIRAAESPVAERYLYLPSVALSIAAAILWSRNLSRIGKRMGVILASVLLVGLAASTCFANTAWMSNLSFWQSVISDPWAKGFGLPWANLGRAYQDAGQTDEAAKAYRAALDPKIQYDDEGRSIAANNLGSLSFVRGENLARIGQAQAAIFQLDYATDMFRTAIRFKPGYAIAYANLGNALLLQIEQSWQIYGAGSSEKLMEARNALTTALSINPRIRTAQIGLEKCNRYMTTQGTKQR